MCIYIYIYMYMYMYMYMLASIHNMPAKWNFRRFSAVYVYLFLSMQACISFNIYIYIYLFNTDIYTNTQTTQGSLWLYRDGINNLGGERDCYSDVNPLIHNMVDWGLNSKSLYFESNALQPFKPYASTNYLKSF